MSFRNWIWVYMATGESFTQWAVLLFYGAVCAVGFVFMGLIAILMVTMAVHR